MKNIYVTLLLVFLSSFATAQELSQIHLSSPYTNGTNSTIKGEDRNGKEAFVKLMGIKPFSKEQSSYDIFLNTIIQDKTTICKIFDKSQRPFVGQCLNHHDQDIALSLIENGIALVNRETLSNNNLKNIYLNAETSARNDNLGEWAKIINTINATDTSSQSTANQNSHLFDDISFYTIIVALIAGPFVGMLIVSMIMYGGFNRLIKLQKYQIASAQQRDRSLREKEKFIVAASLEGEMNANRAKLDAFIMIYEELLSNLRDPSKEPKYKKFGDIIHETPALSRNVFDTNMDKMDLLGSSIVKDLTKLYMSIEQNPKYKTFEPEAPVEDVIEFVSGIVRNAEHLLEPIDKIAGALGTIVRHKK